MSKGQVRQRYATDLFLIGTSFKTSPLHIREELLRQIYFHGIDISSRAHINEYAILQTCNRIEVYAATDDIDSAVKWMQESFLNGFNKEYFYIKTGVDAIEHLYMVASGLDSMLLGEDQILEQVRRAGIDSRRQGMAKGILSTLFDTAVSTGKKVRSIIPKNDDNRSIGSFAIRFVKEKTNLDKDSRILLIGTGKTILLASRELPVDPSHIYLATKRSNTPKGLEGALVIPYSKIPQAADDSDLIVSATNSFEFVLRKEFFSTKRKRLIIDLAVPRNVDPRVKEVEGIELYTLDDLSERFNDMSRITPEERQKARMLAREEAERFRRWLIASRLSPTLSELYKWAEELREQEMHRVKSRLYNDSEIKLIEVMSKRLLSRLLYPPTEYVKSAKDQGQELRRLETVAKVFGLTNNAEDKDRN
ncbi:MAG: glutamyl-tRNA reductase [Nitrososphaerota archaeon]